jgi:hypothetical protein
MPELKSRNDRTPDPDAVACAITSALMDDDIEEGTILKRSTGMEDDADPDHMNAKK